MQRYPRHLHPFTDKISNGSKGSNGSNGSFKPSPPDTCPHHVLTFESHKSRASRPLRPSSPQQIQPQEHHALYSTPPGQSPVCVERPCLKRTACAIRGLCYAGSFEKPSKLPPATHLREDARLIRPALETLPTPWSKRRWPRRLLSRPRKGTADASYKHVSFDDAEGPSGDGFGGRGARAENAELLEAGSAIMTERTTIQSI